MTGPSISQQVLKAIASLSIKLMQTRSKKYMLIPNVLDLNSLMSSATWRRSLMDGSGKPGGGCISSDTVFFTSPSFMSGRRL